MHTVCTCMEALWNLSLPKYSPGKKFLVTRFPPSIYIAIVTRPCHKQLFRSWGQRLLLNCSEERSIENGASKVLTLRPLYWPLAFFFSPELPWSNQDQRFVVLVILLECRTVDCPCFKALTSKLLNTYSKLSIKKPHIKLGSGNFIAIQLNLVKERKETAVIVWWLFWKMYGGCWTPFALMSLSKSRTVPGVLLA